MRRIANLAVLLLLLDGGFVLGQPSEQQLARRLERNLEADANGDGRLTVEEAEAYRQNLVRPQGTSDREGRIDSGAPPEPKIDLGWQRDRFPDHAVCYRSPKEIATTYAKCLKGQRDPVISYAKPADGSLRIVGTGHSFMAPGYQSFRAIARAAGLNQPPLVTHTGGGITGSARYKWEEENGIFQFDGNPTPKLLASIANAEWDAMTAGLLSNPRPPAHGAAVLAWDAHG